MNLCPDVDQRREINLTKLPCRMNYEEEKLTLKNINVHSNKLIAIGTEHSFSHKTLTALFTIFINLLNLLSMPKQQKLMYQGPWLCTRSSSSIVSFLHGLFLTAKMFPHMCVYVCLHDQPHVFRVLPQQPIPFSCVVASSLENFLACQRRSLSGDISVNVQVIFEV